MREPGCLLPVVCEREGGEGVRTACFAGLRWFGEEFGCSCARIARKLSSTHSEPLCLMGLKCDQFVHHGVASKVLVCKKTSMYVFFRLPRVSAILLTLAARGSNCGVSGCTSSRQRSQPNQFHDTTAEVDNFAPTTGQVASFTPGGVFWLPFWLLNTRAAPAVLPRVRSLPSKAIRGEWGRGALLAS